ncbi:hypothetical protein [Deinococcus alpinitundrae]|uniref:hypothetical protein n=1 Tax=Deinococcus alpinitundrae TaxID=468913 RepID=UPI001379EEC1|nr:hypothetical protein [Deinococcus alpinitundrae]
MRFTTTAVMFRIQPRPGRKGAGLNFKVLALLFEHLLQRGAESRKLQLPIDDLPNHMPKRDSA